MYIHVYNYNTYLSAVERLDSVFHLQLQVCRWAPAQSAWSSRAVQCTVCGEWAVGERWEEGGTHTITQQLQCLSTVCTAVLSIYSHTLMMSLRLCSLSVWMSRLVRAFSSTISSPSSSPATHTHTHHTHAQCTHTMHTHTHMHNAHTHAQCTHTCTMHTHNTSHVSLLSYRAAAFTIKVSHSTEILSFSGVTLLQQWL